MESNWKDLFVISLIQWKVPINMITESDAVQTIEMISRQSQNSLEYGHSHYVESFKLIQSMFTKLSEFNLDSIELEFLKLILLLRNGIALILFLLFFFI